jgi:thioredoxin 1
MHAFFFGDITMHLRSVIGCCLAAAALFSFFSCGKQGGVKTSASASAVKTIETDKDYSALIDSSGERLLMFDLYAAWCMPCRVISPVLEKIALEMKNVVSVYKIDVDNNPEIARTFGVTGIPFVVLMKNKTVVQSFIGIQSRETFVSAISKYGEK